MATTSSPVIHITRGPTQENHAGPVVEVTRGPTQENHPGPSVQVILGTSILIHNVIRGPQFRTANLTRSIFIQPLFSILSRTIGISLLSAATTNIFTATAGVTLIHGIVLRITSSTGISADASISIGINPSTTNLFSAQDLINVRNLNDVYSFWSDKSTTLIATATDAIDLTVTNAATGTTLVAEAFVIGTPL